jgi:hypothetical protein
MCTKLVFKYFGFEMSVREVLQEDMNCSSVLLFAPTRLLSCRPKTNGNFECHLLSKS